MKKRPLATLLFSLSTAVLMGTACDGETDEDLVGDGDGDGDGDIGDGDGDGDGDIGDGDGDGDGDLPGDGDGDVGDGDGDSCTDNQEFCDGACTATNADPDHCGECDNECEEGEGCAEGVCEDQGCGDDLISCDDTCIDPLEDEAYCGGCENSCTTGQVCVSGGCLDECPEGFLECGDLCFDPMTDDDRCGAVSCDDLGGGGAGGAPADGLVCTGEEVCELGVCTVTCDEPGEVACGDTCIDPQTDNTYCGATTCADAETSGETCEGGLLCLEGTCRDQVWAWSDAEVISGAGVAGGPLVLEADDSGNLWALFREDGVTRARQYDHNTRKWSSSVTSLDIGTDSVVLAFGTNGSGIAVATKLVTHLVHYSVIVSFLNGGTWSTPVEISDPDGQLVRRDLGVVMDDSGDAIVSWNEGAIFNGAPVVPSTLVVRHFTNGSWQDLTTVDGYSGAGSAHVRGELVHNASGDVVHVWHDNRGANFTDGYNVFGRVWDKSAGTWSPATRLRSAADLPFYSSTGSAQAGIDSNGNGYAVYGEYSGSTAGDLVMSVYDATLGTWAQGASVESLVGRTRTFEMLTLPSGTSHLAMAFEWNDSTIYANEVAPGPSFSHVGIGTSPGSTNANPAYPQMAVGTTGNIHSAWINVTGKSISTADRLAGTWQAPGTIVAPTSVGPSYLRLIAGQGGRAYLAFAMGSAVYYSRYD